MGERGVDFGLLALEVSGGAVGAEPEGVLFDGANSVHAPLVLGQRLGRLGLLEAFRSDVGNIGFDEFLLGVAAGVGHDGDLGSEALAEDVVLGAVCRLRFWGRLNVARCGGWLRSGLARPSSFFRACGFLLV